MSRNRLGPARARLRGFGISGERLRVMMASAFMVLLPSWGIAAAASAQK